MQILNPTPSAVYNGIIQGGYRIATGEGILGLWRGMSSVVVGAGTITRCGGLVRRADRTTGPAHAVYFATYEGVKQIMGGNQAGVHHPLAAGMFCERIYNCTTSDLA
jgi:solute carrier family 25 iron transporter 28/37